LEFGVAELPVENPPVCTFCSGALGRLLTCVSENIPVCTTLGGSGREILGATEIISSSLGGGAISGAGTGSAGRGRVGSFNLAMTCSVGICLGVTMRGAGRGSGWISAGGVVSAI
jgi:hypothetical protein